MDKSNLTGIFWLCSNTKLYFRISNIVLIAKLSFIKILHFFSLFCSIISIFFCCSCILSNNCSWTIHYNTKYMYSWAKTKLTTIQIQVTHKIIFFSCSFVFVCIAPDCASCSLTFDYIFIMYYMYVFFSYWGAVRESAKDTHCAFEGCTKLQGRSEGRTCSKFCKKWRCTEHRLLHHCTEVIQTLYIYFFESIFF